MIILCLRDVCVPTRSSIASNVPGHALSGTTGVGISVGFDMLHRSVLHAQQGAAGCRQSAGQKGNKDGGKGEG